MRALTAEVMNMKGVTARDLQRNLRLFAIDNVNPKCIDPVSCCFIVGLCEQCASESKETASRIPVSWAFQ